jgi:hypothetical protein
MAITLQTNVQRKRTTLAADVGGEVVLMSVERGKYYGLDIVASDVWRHLEAPIAVADLCAALMLEYQGERTTIEREVIDLLEQFSSQDLLEPLSQTAG